MALVAALGIGLDSSGVCPACLSFVAFELDDGDERRVAGQITSMAPNLWYEGLGESVRDALERAVLRGVPDAEEGLRELDHLVFRSRIFRAVVRRLAVALREDARTTYLPVDELGASPKRVLLWIACVADPDGDD
jgi:hypothetical protein